MPAVKPDPSSPTYSPAETRWVEAELANSLMRSVRYVQAPGWLTILIYVGLLWGEVPGWSLALWTLAAVAMAVARVLVIHHHAQSPAPETPQQVLQAMARTRPVWTLSAVVWGSAAMLYFDQLPLASEFAAWLLLAVSSMLAANTLSPDLTTLRYYVRALSLTTLGVVLWRIVVDHHFQGPAYHYWMLAMLAVFWQVLYQAGRRLNQTYRRNFELQYRNSQLIDSLTRQTQAALEAVQIKKRFLASAAHDLRQPVHALGLYADWLANEPALVKDIAPKIVEATRAVNTLFDSLFDLVRLDSGSVRLKLEPVSLDKLLDDLEVQYRPLAEAKGLQLRVRRNGGVVLSDALLLGRIVGNLVSNAIKYTDRGGVLLAVRHAGGTPRIEVWDTGIGIEAAHRQDIFREFYKVPSHPGTQDGFGLGLYIVSRLSHILGHPVALDSRQGRGTVFRLRLTPTDPVQAAARAAQAAGDQLPSRP